MTDRKIVSWSYLPNHPDKVGWKKRHHLEMLHNAPSQPMGVMIKSWVRYAVNHYTRFGSHIGDDYVLGDHWAQMGVGLRGLLCGDIGHLDGGTCDHIIVQNLINQGFDEEGARADSE